MSKLYFTAALSALALGFASQANAGIVLIDDFSSNAMEVHDGADTSSAGGRTLSIGAFTHFGSPATPNAEVFVVPGVMLANNGPLQDSTVTLTYDIAANLELANTLSLKLDFLFNDNAAGGDNTVEAFLDGGSLGVKTLSTEGVPFSIAFAVSEAQAAILAAGGTNLLSFVFNGSPGWDLVLDTVSAVPEPGMIGLLGLGVAGIGFASRRRKVA